MFAWPWCNLAASQRRPYCASVNSLFPVGLVSRQWDAVDWACVLGDYHIHIDQASRSENAPAHSLSLVHVFWPSITSPRSVTPLQLVFGSLRLLAFPKTKIAVEKEEICDCDGHTAHKVSHWRLTADWLAPRESDCSRTHSKVSSDWLPSYIKATRPVLEIFKMVGYFVDSPHTYLSTHPNSFP